MTRRSSGATTFTYQAWAMNSIGDRRPVAICVTHSRRKSGMPSGPPAGAGRAGAPSAGGLSAVALTGRDLI